MVILQGRNPKLKFSVFTVKSLDVTTALFGFGHCLQAPHSIHVPADFSAPTWKVQPTIVPVDTDL